MLPTSNQSPVDYIEVDHPQWSATMTIYPKENRAMSSLGDWGDIIRYDYQYLILKWDNWGTEYFTRKGERYKQCMKEDISVAVDMANNEVTK